MADVLKGRYTADVARLGDEVVLHRVGCHPDSAWSRLGSSDLTYPSYRPTDRGSHRPRQDFRMRDGALNRARCVVWSTHSPRRPWVLGASAHSFHWIAD